MPTPTLPQSVMSLVTVALEKQQLVKGDKAKIVELEGEIKKAQGDVVKLDSELKTAQVSLSEAEKTAELAVKVAEEAVSKFFAAN